MEEEIRQPHPRFLFPLRYEGIVPVSISHTPVKQEEKMSLSGEEKKIHPLLLHSIPRHLFPDFVPSQWILN